ncbi:hypothetical protein FRC11_004170 [Ceratobasidium sp. 423]|nr:hypothetical protein FRC11_004170 [Ceratobasidium sp. 423]
MVRPTTAILILAATAGTGSVPIHRRDEVLTLSTTGTHIFSTRAAPEDYLIVHNNERASHGASALIWDEDPGSSVQAWANHQAGQNLYAGTRNPTAADAVGAWNAESKDYNPEDTKPSHWTQVVWKDTTKLGCALKQCGPGTIFDAKYITCPLCEDSRSPSNLICHAHTRRQCKNYHIDVEACIRRNKKIEAARTELWDLAIFAKVVLAAMATLHEDALIALDEST